MRIYAIGDIHGCADQQARLYDRIDAEIARDQPADWRIIHIGDFCDRGPETRRVLEQVIARSADSRVLSLMGNHDEALLDFLRNPVPGNLFVRSGGDTTALSYGVTVDFSTEGGRLHARDALREAIPADHLAFLENLPRSLVVGDYFFCHAGIRPGVALDNQDPEDLIWIRREFLESTELFAKVVVHGHTPARVPELLPNRINIDTGAVKGGELTAVVLENTTRRFISIGR